MRYLIRIQFINIHIKVPHKSSETEESSSRKLLLMLPMMFESDDEVLSLF